MSGRARIVRAALALGCVASSSCWSTNLAFGALADESCFWGAPGARTTYLPPYDPSEAPAIPLLKRSATSANGSGTRSVGEKENGEASVGPRVGDSGTFVGTDGKTYYYRFVEGVRRRAVVETRPDPSSPSGWRKVWRYVDEPRLIKQIWPMERRAAVPAPCQPVENGVEASESDEAGGASDAAPSTATENEPPVVYRATVRATVP